MPNTSCTVVRDALFWLLLACGTAHAAEEVWPYTIAPGDTLIGLRDHLLQPGASWRQLQRLNRIKDPRRLIPGRTLNIPLHMLREQALGAEVLHSHGEVELLRSGSPARPLVAGDSLQQGDLLRTGSQSSASLRFEDGTRVLLRPDSALRLERSVRRGNSPAVDTRLRLDSGGADSRVVKQPVPRFELRTPVANLGVRGTEFRTRAEASRTLVEVLEGRVAAAALALDGGFGALISPERTQAPRALPPAPQLAGLPARVERLPLRLAWPFPGRVAITIALLAPLAFALGMPFPSGVSVVSVRTPELVPWGWAVNAFLSVFSSIFCILLAMEIGFSEVLIGAALVYAAGFVALASLAGTPVDETPT